MDQSRNQSFTNQSNLQQEQTPVRQINIAGITGFICGIVTIWFLYDYSWERMNTLMVCLLILLSIFGIISSILGISKSKKIGGYTISIISLIINIVPQLFYIIMQFSAALSG